MATADIYADLKRDHDKQREMLKELAELKGDGAKRKKLFEAFRIEIQSHAAAEEESLYATMLGEPELRDDARRVMATSYPQSSYLRDGGFKTKSDPWWKFW